MILIMENSVDIDQLCISTVSCLLWTKTHCFFASSFLSALPNLLWTGLIMCRVDSTRSSCHLPSSASVITGISLCVWNLTGWFAYSPVSSQPCPAPLPAVCHSDVSTAIGRQELRLPVMEPLLPDRHVVQSRALCSTQTSLSHFHSRQNTVSKMLSRHFLTNTMG